MFNEHSLAAVKKSTFSKHFARPLYDSYCFSRIPDTIKALLGVPNQKTLPTDALLPGDYDTVILLLIDGFGWKMFEKCLERFPFLQKMLEKGIASKITSQFPSTTAVHITSINSGLCLPQHGIYEWFYYEPVVDRVITPLLFSFAGDHQAGGLRKTGVMPEDFLPRATFYESLAEAGIDSYVVQLASIADSPYSQAMSKGAQMIPYHTLQEALSRAEAQTRKRKSYFFIYYPEVDAIGHRKGIESEAFDHCLTDLMVTLEAAFSKKVKDFSKTALLITADHGMIAVQPDQTLYLNRLLPKLEQLMVQNRAGNPIVPAGSARDFFLHIKPECLTEAEGQLREKLGDYVEIHRTEQLLKEGLFGNVKPTKQFLDRLGNLVLLPKNNETVWWYVRGHFEQHFYALHGGLSREELEIPFLFLRI